MSSTLAPSFPTVSPSFRKVSSLDDSESPKSSSPANISPRTPNQEEASSLSASKQGELDDCKWTVEELLCTKTPSLHGDDVTSKREEIREYFHRTFTLYEKLFEVLKDDNTFYMQPEKLRHPLIFYWGHTAVFFINKLRLARLLPNRINEKLESTCAVGVDEMSWDDLNDKHYDWPTVQTIREYRDTVRTTVDDLITNMPLTLPITWESPFWIILMGIEHERIHLETSSVLFRQLPIDQVKTHHPMWKICDKARHDPTTVPQNELLTVPATHINIGKSMDHDLYGWDNEYGAHQADVKEFKASKFIVSNKEFLEFVQDGGYEQQEWWGEEGWKFVQFKKAQHPVFWVPVDRDSTTNQLVFKYRTMTAEIDMPWDWPVDCNYIEAKAWCRWKSSKLGVEVRLPTEDEWHALLKYTYPEKDTLITKHMDGTVTTKEQINDQSYWTKAPGNVNLEFYASSNPIDMFPFLNGFYDVMGNVWQHTETPIYPFKGFKFHPIYDDFTIPTFDTRHNLIKGGSWISTGNESTRLSRYAFRRHFYQHAGFRYVVGEPIDTQQTLRLCENDAAVVQMIDTQYQPSPLPGILSVSNDHSNYSVQLARIAQDAYAKFAANPAKRGHAADIGCATGRTSFELATGPLAFDHVTGLDTSTRFIRIASQLQFEGSVEYSFREEGDLESFHEIDMKQLNLDPKALGFDQKVEFLQADACNLDNKYTGYDLVLAANLIEYLIYPAQFLKHITSRVNRGGLLVIVSSYKWDSSITPKENWLGGFKENGESLDTLTSLERHLAPHFELQGIPFNMVYVARTAGRAFDVRTPQVTIWKRV